tara:strand:- start:6893 stop:7612 length:720 start_codon:yes stop_codon:yes gene_type:complete
MKYLLAVFSILILISTCAKEEKNTLIKGEITGLKKGTLYLEKIEDTTLVILDSLVLKGTSQFSFSLQLESPEMVYLYLRKTEGDKIADGIEIFAAPGTIEVKTTLEDFEADAKVTGSENHYKLEEFNKLKQRYTDKSLEYFQESFDAEKANDTQRINEINKKYETLVRSKYMATVNYALNNKSYEVAPYLALSEIFDANIKYLDTIYQSLTPEVKTSTYGNELERYIAERKELESEMVQ